MRLMTVLPAGGSESSPEPVVLDAAGDLRSLRPLGHGSVRALIEAGPDAWARAAAAALTGELPALGPASGAAAVLPPVPDPPRNMFCVGTNYRAHIAELDRPAGEGEAAAPVVFTKPWTCLTGHGADVPLHPGATGFVDWEAEFVAVIGTPGADLAPGDALAHVFGYTLGNDVTARDLQKPGGKAGQWFKGKSLDGFAPTGPVLVTADEVGDPAGLTAQLTVNGAVRQRLLASEMIHDVPAILAHLSRGMRLLPGDLVFTGTAAGVGAGMRPPVSLHDGDVVEVTSARLGTLRNRFVDTPPR